MNRKQIALLIGAIAIAAVVIWWQSGTRYQTAGAKTPATTTTAARHARLRSTIYRPPQQKQRGVIAGRVSDTNDAPIAKATVCAHAYSRRLSSEAKRQPRCAQSDADGSYRIDNLLTARYLVDASAPTYIPARYHKDANDTFVHVAAGQEQIGIDLVLLAGGVEITGVVNDISGGPVGAALVKLRHRDWKRASTVRADEDGRFSAWVAPGRVRVNATADGYAPGSARGTAPGHTIDVLLTPEALLVGRVIDATTHAPIANATVRSGGDSAGIAITDADGRFRFSRLPPGRYKPQAEDHGRYGVAAASVRLGLGETSADVVIELHAVRTLSGHVLVDDDTPCTAGKAVFSDSAQSHDLSATIENDGRVYLPAILPGDYSVAIKCHNHLAEADYPNIVIADKDLEDLEWRVAVGGRIMGRVVDDNDNPVADARIVAANKENVNRPGDWADSDTQGGFVLKGLPAGRFRLQVYAEGLDVPRDEATIELHDNEEKRVTVKMSSGGTIMGSVVDELGNAIAGANVRASPVTRYAWRYRTYTRDDGSFELKGILDDRVRIMASRGEWLRGVGKTDDDIRGKLATIVRGGTTTVQLIVENQMGKISGTVVDSTGQPVTDAFVVADRESNAAGANRQGRLLSARWRRGWQSGRPPSLTDDDGRFTVSALSSGRYSVSAFRKGGGEAIAYGVALDTSIEITIKSQGSLAGRLLVSDGAPPEQFVIRVSDEKTGFARSETFFRTNGRWSFGGLPAAQYWIGASSSAGTARKQITLAVSQQRNDIELLIQPLTTVSGRIVALDTKLPLKNVRVWVQPVTGAAKSYWRHSDASDRDRITGADGKFIVKDAPIGHVYVAATPNDWQDSRYGFGMKVVRLSRDSQHDVGDVALPHMGIKRTEKPGDLGFTLREQPPDIPPEARSLNIAHIREGGPAQAAGLEVGDEIVAIDGYNVKGTQASRQYSLFHVGAGTRLRLTLGRDNTVELIVGPPL